MKREVIVGRLTRLAVERHYRDLVNGHERGLWFDPARAQYIIDFFPRFLRHIRGARTGEPIVLELWQQFWLAVQFGWRRADGTRRFRQWYEEVGRKNGKSTKLSGIGLHLTAFDGEPGAKVYTAATKLEQAKITHGDAELMVDFSPALKRLFTRYRNRIFVPGTANEFVPLGADAKTLDGLDPHGSIIDELHAHKSRDLWDVIVSAMGARREPMLTAITTAGFDRHGICYEQRQLLLDVLEGKLQDDSLGGVIYTLDERDDWKNPKHWVKANPNLGVSVRQSYLEEQCRKAVAIIAQQNNFKTKHLNIWCKQENRWIDIDLWDRCKASIDIDALRGRACYGGLDLASTTDLAAFVLVFEPTSDDPTVYVLPFLFVPQDNIELRAREAGVPYEQWVEQGHLIATAGNVTDYDVIREKMLWARDTFDLREVGFDRWNATHLVNQLLADEIAMVALGQNMGTLSAPTKRLEELLLSKRLGHGGHPVLRWCAENVTVLRDSNGNYRPDKGKSTEKIDGILALVMALNRLMSQVIEEKSFWES